jgi:hypothetical protein
MENYLPKTMDFYLPKSMDFSLPFTSTQPNLISDSFLAKKYTLDMFPRTHIEGLG